MVLRLAIVAYGLFVSKIICDYKARKHYFEQAAMKAFSPSKQI